MPFNSERPADEGAFNRRKFTENLARGIVAPHQRPGLADRDLALIATSAPIQALAGREAGTAGRQFQHIAHRFG